jgi:opacity protein-like surface antigen
MKKLLSLLVVTLVVFAVPALAATQPGSGEIGMDVGSTQLDSDTGFDSATSLAVRGGYFFNKNFELEGQMASASDSTDVAGTSVDGTFRTYMVNGVYNFQTPKEIVPYVLAGVGLADTQVEASGLSASDNSTAFQVGAGSRFFFGKEKRAAFRFDLSMIKQNTFDESTTNTNLSAGFTWKLGGK